MIRPNGETLFLNGATKPMFGLSPDQLNGSYEIWAQHIHPDDRAKIVALRKESLAGKQELHVEYRLINQEGSLVYCFDHAVPVFNEKQEFYRMDGIIIDQTVQKELQEKILQTQELETLSQISARLAHELRNPLAAIGGLARRIVKSFEATDDRAEKGRMILEQVQKLEKILNMMLGFITPQEVRLQPGDLNQVVAQAIAVVTNKLHSAGFSVKAKLDQGLLPIPLDEKLLENALATLMENAWQRMAEKEEIGLTTQKIGGLAVLALTYRLPHISAEDIEQYFYPFAVDYASVSHRPGSELVDVSISKVVIHKHGGKITVTQEADHNIRITIVLPFH
jgi:PAS domain S-box-containing protein